jgi:hypothetical protein
MPVVTPLNLSSPPTNAYGLYQYLAQRLPGYDPSEYLRELNSAYIHVWEEVAKLRNMYFTNQATVTVNTAQTTFDLMFNLDGALSAAVSPRYYQALRVRVQPPGGGLFQATQAMSIAENDFLAVAANPTSTPTQTGPYYWFPIGRNSIQFALPLATGTKLEVTYVFWPLALTYDSSGTVSSAGAAITGVGSKFTQILQPDFQSYLPASTSNQELAQFELVCNLTQVYRVLTVTSDTALTTLTAPAPALGASSPYVLAVLPDIPREHIRVVASVAMAKMYSVAGDDQRAQEWYQISEKNILLMKDSLLERQSNNPPTKKRFPYGVGRRNRAFLR